MATDAIVAAKLCDLHQLLHQFRLSSTPLPESAALLLRRTNVEADMVLCDCDEWPAVAGRSLLRNAQTWFL